MVDITWQQLYGEDKKNILKDITPSLNLSARNILGFFYRYKKFETPNIEFIFSLHVPDLGTIPVAWSVCKMGRVLYYRQRRRGRQHVLFDMHVIIDKMGFRRDFGREDV